jgi:hypothetical protein
MPELGLSGSVRGVSSNAHPYRDPRPFPVIRGSAHEIETPANTRTERAAMELWGEPLPSAPADTGRADKKPVM